VTARLVEWHGPQIAQRVREAELAAVQEVVLAAAEQAASGRSGRAAQVVVVEPAHETAQGVNAKWGVPPEPHGDPHWELQVETGTAYLPGDSAKRRAADAQYGRLAGRIRARRGG